MANPEIYVACLAAYNNSKLHGTWIDATQDEWDISEAIAAMIKKSPEPYAGDWAVHDYRGFFDAGRVLGEHPNLEKLSIAANLIQEHDELASEVISHYCGDIDEAQKALEDKYLGEYDSLSDYAAEQCEELIGNIPDHIVRYIDYDGMGRDYELGGDVFTIKLDGKVHIFTNHWLLSLQSNRDQYTLHI